MNYEEFDKKYIWHPFTQESLAGKNINIVKGRGIYVYDENNKKYIDAVSSWWTNIHGHCNKDITKAIYQQTKKLEHIIFAGFTNKPAVELVEVLKSLLDPSFDKFFFSDNGSTAIEIALKMCYQFWKNKGEDNRKIFVTMQGNYHGDTFGAMSVGKSCNFYKPFEDLFFDVEYLPYPTTWIGDKEVINKENKAIDYIEKFLKNRTDKIVCLLLESIVQGASGMQIVRPEFINKLCNMFKKHNIPVIFDEVMTGFCRTGTMFAYEQTNFVPDIICLSKALTGGFLPMALTVVTDKIYKEFYSKNVEKTFLHGHSYTANPISCAAALASAKIFKENKKDIICKIEEIRNIHEKEIKKLAQKYNFIKKCRVCGLISAFDIEYPNKNNVSSILKKECLEKGIIIRPLGNTIYIMPPYCIKENELFFIYSVIGNIFSNL